ncbi:hypothetical protein QQP08_020121 [Theobroma cacao]|nr:hypothetical protein QQP08_020121 [Theobroma cacao]
MIFGTYKRLWSAVRKHKATVQARKVSETVSYFDHKIRATGKTNMARTRAYSMAESGKPEKHVIWHLWLTENILVRKVKDIINLKHKDACSGVNGGLPVGFLC